MLQAQNKDEVNFLKKMFLVVTRPQDLLFGLSYHGVVLVPAERVTSLGENPGGWPEHPGVFPRDGSS